MAEAALGERAQQSEIAPPDRQTVSYKHLSASSAQVAQGGRLIRNTFWRSAMFDYILRATGWKNGHDGNGNRPVPGAPLPAEPTNHSSTVLALPFGARVDPSGDQHLDPLPEQASDQASEPTPISAVRLGEGVVVEDEPYARSVIHEALKGLDVWFGYQVSALEKDALRHAVAWAERGLPRHDLEAHEPIEVEKDLTNRAGQTYWQWVREVRRRMNSALSRQLTSFRAALSGANRALESYRKAQQELERLNPRGASRENTAEKERKASGTERHDKSTPVRDTRLAESHLLAPAFWLLTIALVLAEFIANAPIFTELFPQDAQIDAQLSTWLDPSAGMSWFTGLQNLGAKLLAYPDPSFLAFSVVVFFLFLGHKFGAYLRRSVAFGNRHPEVPEELRMHLKRQTTLVVWGSAAGILIILAVLFWARATVFDMAKTRHAYAQTQLDAAKKKVAQAEASADRHDLGTARTDRNFWMVEYEHRQRRLDYAESISKMNLPITGLNLVLVIAAAIAGFSRQEVTVSYDQKAAILAAAASTGPDEPTGKGGDAAADDGRHERIASLREILRAQRVEMARRLADAERSYINATQLAEADPMREWQGITSRLSSAVSMFRAENARLRNLDTRDIKAFNHPTRLDFAEPTFTAPVESVKQLAEYLSTMNALTKAYDEITRPVRIDRRAAEMPAPTPFVHSATSQVN